MGEAQNPLAAPLVVDHRSGERLAAAEWVDRFTRHWSVGAADLDAILALLGPEVRLAAPGLRPTRGQVAARRAFESAFHAMPDLTARVTEWSIRGDVLFIAMTFQATIGNRSVEWANVDLIRFEGGVAVERVAHYDPTALRRAFLSSLAAVRQYIRLKRGARRAT